MPVGISKIELLSDGSGLRITTTQRGVIEINESDIPANVINRPPDEIEAWVNTRLSTLLPPPPHTAIHIFSRSPLRLTIYTGNTPPQGSWWLQFGRE